MIRSIVTTFVLLAGLAGAALAQTGDQVVAPLKGVTALSVYAKPYDAKPESKVAAKDVGFPLDVIAADGDFLQVKLGGKAVWLDGAEVNVGKPVAYGCVKDEKKPTRTASIQGASSGCK